MNRYKQYINSNEWRDRRRSKIGDARRCAVCGETEGLSVHHKNYKRLGNERTDDLIVLCKSCHWIWDKERKEKSGVVKQYRTFRDKTKPSYVVDKELEKELHPDPKLPKVKKFGDCWGE